MTTLRKAVRLAQRVDKTMAWLVPWDWSDYVEYNDGKQLRDLTERILAGDVEEILDYLEQVEWPETVALARDIRKVVK